MDSEYAAALIQKSVSEARKTLETLHERGLIEAKGERKGRVYHLSASIYKRLGNLDGYNRTHGFNLEEQKSVIISHIQQYGLIKRAQVSALCKTTLPQATQLLKNMVKHGVLERSGTARKNAHYVLKNRPL
jgi:ATP-dependent DNA helicase RecG